MTTIQLVTPLEANGARTSDWIERVKGHVIYAYDLDTLTTENADFNGFTKKDFGETPKRVSLRRKPSL